MSDDDTTLSTDPDGGTPENDGEAGHGDGSESSVVGDGAGELDSSPIDEEPADVQSDEVDDVHGVLDQPPQPVDEARGRTDWVIFGIGGIAAVAFVVWGAVSTKSLASVAESVLNWVISNLGWMFVLSASAFVVFALWIAVSRYGRIPLGRDGERPEFRTVSWVAMMFSAGMGIGLMFYGVVEPLKFFTEPPPGSGIDPGTSEAMQKAMSQTMFHWTLHPWAIYAVLGLAIAYSAFRKGRRQLISSVFAPLLGERPSNGTFGKFIDILAIFATLFGSAASLGLGALQIGRGLQEVNWIGGEAGKGMLVTLIAVLTCAFIASAVSGVAKGIQWLSNINMVLAGVLAIFVFVVGPTLVILNTLPTAVGDYMRDLAEMAARTETSTNDPETREALHKWLSSYTVFYWAWWISWSPFVSMFIARISRGRSIRQFVVGVLLVPSVVSLIWFAIFGATAMQQQHDGADLAGQSTEEGQLFGMLQGLDVPGGWVTVASVVVMILVGIFFVSGADAASIVMGTLTQRGSIEPRKWIVIFWGALTGAVGAIMLLIGDENALTGLKNLTVMVGLPFMFVMVALCVSLVKDLRNDPLMKREERSNAAVEEAIVEGTQRYGADFQIAVTPSSNQDHGGHRPISGERPRTAPYRLNFRHPDKERAD